MKKRSGELRGETGSMAEPRQEGLAERLAAQVDFEHLGEELGKDVEQSISHALLDGARFPGPESSPLGIFREGLAECIRSIRQDERWVLFQRFLTLGPIDSTDDPRAGETGDRLSDAETHAVISFLFRRVINSFQGLLAEWLAAAPCTELLRELKRARRLPEEAVLYGGDTIRVPRRCSPALAKGADYHVLSVRDTPARVQVHGVVEVKSFSCGLTTLADQVERHLRRLRRGLQVEGRPIDPADVHLEPEGVRATLRVTVGPSYWLLPRTFRFVGEQLRVDDRMPPSKSYKIEQNGPVEWQVTLRWSHEALAAVAHEMTFWYMGQVGEAAYADGVPPEWAGMTPEEAGRNAVKSSLYYAILRSRTPREESQATALYNSYGFGYALGMNFKDRTGRRRMLWFDDLREIQQSGSTVDGFSI